MDQKKPSLRLKVCGMRNPKNIEELLTEAPDYMGMIFYEKSPRHVEGYLVPEDIPSLGSTRLIGVFVDAAKGYVRKMVKQYGLRGLQLHGNESPAYCKTFRDEGLQIIKAFSIGKEKFDFSQLHLYEDWVDYFLFDTKGKLPGGNGITFRWDILSVYVGNTPFFLSGGIHPDHVQRIKDFQHPLLYGLDINSQFEIEPGKKDVETVHKFWQEVKGKG